MPSAPSAATIGATSAPISLARRATLSRTRSAASASRSPSPTKAAGAWARTSFTAPIRRSSWTERAAASGSTPRRSQSGPKRGFVAAGPRGARARCARGSPRRACVARELDPIALQHLQELAQLLPPLDALGHEAPGGEREAHDVVGLDVALEEADPARAVEEQGAHDLLDLVLDPVPELAGRQEAALHEHLAEARRRREAALGLAQLVEAQHAGAEQALAEAVHHLVRGGEHDLAAVQPDGLHVLAGG